MAFFIAASYIIVVNRGIRVTNQKSSHSYPRLRLIHFGCLKPCSLLFLIVLKKSAETKKTTSNSSISFRFSLHFRYRAILGSHDEIMTNGRYNITLFYIIQTAVDGPFNGKFNDKKIEFQDFLEAVSNILLRQRYIFQAVNL